MRIFRRSRLVVLFWGVLMPVAAFLFVCCSIGTLASAFPLATWSMDKVWKLATWVVVAGTSFQLTLASYYFWREARRTQVVLDDAGIRLLLTGLDHEASVPWSAVTRVTHSRTSAKPRYDLYRIHTSGGVYTLSKHNCASPAEIARLVAERRGFQVVDEPL